MPVVAFPASPKHLDAHLYVKTVKMVGHWLVAVRSFVESDLKHFLFHFYYITQMLYMLNERLEEARLV